MKKKQCITARIRQLSAPRPGQLTLWAMQSVAHGADFISFFRWRTCTVGTEIYWHGILDYDNRDNRKLAEIKDFYSKLQKLNPVCGAEYMASFALIKDYDNEWDAEVDSWHRRVSRRSEQEIFSESNVTKLFEYTEIDNPFAEYIEAPETLELIMRRKEERKFLFILNFQAQEVPYTLKKSAKLLYSEEILSGNCTLPAYGTAVYDLSCYN